MRNRRILAVAAASAVALVVPFAASQAATPASQTVSVPSSAPATKTITWSGTVPVGANPTSQCDGTTPEDVETLNIAVPSGYGSITATFEFNITWKPVVDSTANDEILTVTGPPASGENGVVGSSDGGSPSETVTANDLIAGTYKVRACGFANSTPQPYQGRLTITTKDRSAVTSPPSAPANGLAFSASVAADPQRDEAEPLIETAPDGKTYTCGPTGFGSASDYAQVSTDGGDQFHLLGTPPRGQQAVGGGGDCAISLAPDKNGQGKYTYSYAGLGALNGFTTSRSEDNGRTIQNVPVQGNLNTDKGVLTDRQWLVALDKDTVLLSYNQQVPRNIVVQRSDDGGLTYSPFAAIGGANPDFPGPMRTLPAKFNTKKPGTRIVYFGWSQGANANLSVSYDGGKNFVDCVAAVAPGQPRAGFVSVDNDSQGNIYLAYAEKAQFNSFLVTLPISKLGSCNQAIGNGPTTAKSPKNDPQAIGWSTPLQVDRDKVRTTVFPWVAAGGAPGRVAVTFYGTETEGDPNTGSFKASWNVYVNQSVNALSSGRTFSQVKATTHPFHYDSICLNGLGCTVTNGDRSLADFFAIKTNPASGRLQVVYNNDAKIPGEAFGHVASPMVFTQIGGPSIKGGTISGGNRPVVRSSSTDPPGDALANYSATFGPANPPVSPTPTNEPATDFRSIAIGPRSGGGFTLTMKLASLSQADLDKAIADTGSQSLLYTLRFSNGYQPYGVTARYSPSGGWSYKVNDYDSLATECFAAPSTSDDKCLSFAVAGTPLQGSVNQGAGTITISVPLLRPGSGKALLYALKGGTGDQQRPSRVQAYPGSRFYDASVFSFGDASLSDTVPGTPQTYLYPLDNTPAMDFKLP